MKNAYIDIVMDNGELVRVEVPQKHEDDFWQSLENAMKRRDWFSFSQWESCEALYMGLHVDRINGARIIATL